MKEPAVYIVTNKKNGTLYVGVTSNLPHRVSQHKEGVVDGFTTGLTHELHQYRERSD